MDDPPDILQCFCKEITSFNLAPSCQICIYAESWQMENIAQIPEVD
jgi:hypothetical protein